MSTVLVIDDDAMIREAMHDALQDEGYTVALAGSGAEALAYLRRSRPDLILLDWNMAPMNAPQFMEQVAQDEQMRTIPVVLITADIRVDDKVKTAPYKGFLRKPVELDALYSLVAAYATHATP